MTEPVSRLSEPWLRVFSMVTLLVVWELGARIVDSSVLPDPWQVAASIYAHAAAGELLYHVGITLARVGVSFFIAMALGTALGVFMGRNRRWNVLLDGLLVVGLNVPALVIIILCYIWFGLGEFAAILAVAVNKFPIVVVTMREGARAIDKDLLQVAEAFRLNRQRTFFKVYLPQLYPYLVASARSGLALVWKIVLVVELLGRSNGVGFKLSVYFQFFDITSILAFSFAFIAVVMAIELALFGPLDRRLTEWRP
ncbi:MAG: ABC transporter permease [Rhodospirillales bacterium]